MNAQRDPKKGKFFSKLALQLMKNSGWDALATPNREREYPRVGRGFPKINERGGEMGRLSAQRGALPIENRIQLGRIGLGLGSAKEIVGA